MHKIYLLAVLALPALSGCTDSISALAKDPATVSVHQTITAPGWSVTTDYTRAGATGALGAAGANGASVGTVNKSTTTSPAGNTSDTAAVPATGTAVPQ